MATAVVIYDPKAVGKSLIAQILTDQLGVYHVDTDALVLRALAQGVKPHPVVGWLEPVTDRVLHALEEHDVVSVEATGAWDGDWQLARDLEDHGIKVLRIWVTAPGPIAMRRLANRKIRRAPVTPEEAAEIYDLAVARAKHEQFDVFVDTTSPPDPFASLRGCGTYSNGDRSAASDLPLSTPGGPRHHPPSTAVYREGLLLASRLA